MNKDALTQLKQKLEERKAKAEKELASIARKDTKVKGDYDTQFPDFGTHQSQDESALEVADYERTLPLEYALEIKLLDIDKALEKIAKGKYGFCEKCGAAIDEKRLEAAPESRLCIKCQK